MLSGKRDLARVFALVAAATLVYWPVFTAGFVYDDHLLVTGVAAYEQFDLGAIMLGLGNGLEYLPIRDLSIALDVAIWGEDPFGFHLSNLLLYLVSVVLLYSVTLATGRFVGHPQPTTVAFLATLLFAVHPLNTEVVAFIAARNNLLAVIFILISVLGFLRGSEGNGGGLIVCLLAFVLSMLSKASSVFYPWALALICVAVTPIGQWRRSVVVTLAVLLGLSLAGAFGHAAVAVATGMSQPDLARFGVADWGASLIRSALIPAFYLRYFFWPWPQTISHDETAWLAFANPSLAVLLLVGYGSCLLIAYRFRRRWPLVLVGLGWFFASLAPVSNLVPTVPYVAERYLFPGMMGLTMILAVSLCGLRSQVARWSMLLVVSALLGAVTFHRAQVWQSDLTLWEAAWRVTPRTGAHTYFYALLESGRAEQAVKLAAEEQPRSYRYALMRCESLLRKDRYREATSLCDQAVSESAGFSNVVRLQTRIAAARAHAGAGDPMQAIHHYVRAAEDDSPTARLLYANEVEHAIADLRTSLAPMERDLRTRAAAEPGGARAHGDLGLFLVRTGRFEEAAQQLQHALALEPDNWQIEYNLGLAAIKSGDLATARNAFTSVPKAESAYSEGLNHLASHHSRAGDHAAALAYWREAIARQPTIARYRYNLARHHLRRGNREMARAVLLEGLESNDPDDRAFYRQTLDNLGLERPDQ